ncbi:MAG: phenylacetate--CoA ligase [Clostridia bacterium]|nr:phenylacetate--CoA ligase [Clostridia bacterium]
MKYYDEKLECMERSDLKKLQSERLVKLVEYVYKNVPAYRKKMDEKGVSPADIKGVKDITKLPFTLKSDLRDNYPFGLFAVPMDKINRIHASSGTTGKQTVVGYTKGDLDVWADCISRGFVSCGIEPGDMVHVAYGYGLFTGGLGVHDGATRLGCSVVPASSGNTARQVTLIEDFKPDAICCTPSYALFLGEELHKKGHTAEDISLKVGIFGAEPWSEAMRTELERSLGIKACDIYGLSEIMGPGVACECSERKGMHLQEDHFLVEVIDPETGEHVKEGESGELVFTTLTKEGFPLIRYRTRDISRVIYDRCSCGRTTARILKPSGRSDDMLIIRGVNVFPSQVETVLMEFSETSPYYMIYVDRQNNHDTMEVKVEMTEAFFSDKISDINGLEARLKSRLNSLIGLSIGVTLVEPGTLPRFEGKSKHVVDYRVI